jgi:hypothetical protein
MNPGDARHENERGGFMKGAGICLCCLVVGFLLGVALDAKNRPNNILLTINPDSKVSLSPQPGDMIRWATPTDPQGTSVNINFTAGFAPCLKNTGILGASCVYDPIAGGPSLYLYGCTSNQPPNSCYDPAFGPRCGSCPTPGTHPPPFLIKYFVNTLIWDIARLFSEMAALPETPQNLGGSTGSPGDRGQEVHALEPAAPPRVIEVAAVCAGNAPAVFPSGSSGSVTSLTAEPSDTITWNPYGEYSITGLESVCTGGNPSSSGNQSCTIKTGTASSAPYTYTLKMTCGGAPASATEKIFIQGSVAAPMAGNK